VPPPEFGSGIQASGTCVMSNFTTETSEPPLRIELRSPGLEDLAAHSSAGGESSGRGPRTPNVSRNRRADCLLVLSRNGAGEKNRTPNKRITNALLCQLSYTSVAGPGSAPGSLAYEASGLTAFPSRRALVRNRIAFSGLRSRRITNYASRHAYPVDDQSRNASSMSRPSMASPTDTHPSRLLRAKMSR
jgi:hypothetical protein